MKKISKLELIVFICGASVMILELLGARIIAPYLGTSIYIWASLIGIILGALSLGYWLGGKLADLKPKPNYLAGIILASAVFIGILPLFKDSILEFGALMNIKLGGIFAAFFLFAIPSILLGMVSPYALKLKIKNIQTSGKTAGTLYALSTLGSIFGTFLAGFWLIPYFKLEHILFGISLVLILTSIMAYSLKRAILLSAFFLVTFSGLVFLSESLNAKYLVEKDSAYNHIEIYDTRNKEDRPIRILRMGSDFHSAMYLDQSDELVFEYTKFYRLGDFFYSNIKKALMIGGGAYSVPKDFLKRHSQGEIDVVEIDPEVTKLAKTYFDLKEDERLRVFHEDGRIYLNNNQEKYDVIYNDAFSSTYAIPHQLTTKEVVEKMHNALNKNGVLITNVISALSGEKSEFFKAEYKTLKTVFPNVLVFPVETQDQKTVQNIMIVSLKNKDFDLSAMLNSISGTEFETYFNNLENHIIIPSETPILTDSFAPVEYLIGKIL
ncbi:MAG: fused MFS/spermidine synthase [Candidatus Paceibacterota bacterium]|jgi:spermidine synthase